MTTNIKAKEDQLPFTQVMLKDSLQHYVTITIKSIPKSNTGKGGE